MRALHASDRLVFDTGCSTVFQDEILKYNLAL